MTLTEDRLHALAAAAAALAGELDLDTVLSQIVRSSAELTGARYAALGVLDDDGTISRFITHGASEETIRAIGRYPTGKGLLGVLIRDPQVLRLDCIQDHPASVGFPEQHPEMTNFLGAPVRSGGRIYGNLYLCEKTGGFTEADEALITVMAAQAGAAVENATLSQQLRTLAVQDERDRISRELHDGVIQTLFSIGMGLESARALLPADAERLDQRLNAAIESIDGAIRELRNHIFRLRPSEAATMGLSRGLAELAREYEVNALVRPSFRVQSDLDARVQPGLIPDLLQMVREALSNCAKHAGASHVDISAHVADGTVQLEIADDGIGFTPSAPQVGRGLDNIRERAAAVAGDFEIDSTPGKGTAVRIAIPLEEE